jgi:CubicO group peptidase (beta-lactamase class C family)
MVLFDGDGPRGTASGGLAVPEHGIPFTPETPSRWASVSKQFCAAAVLRAGFDLEAPLGAWVPGLPEAIGAVPLGRALDMTGGIPDVMETLWLLGQPFTAGVSEEALLSFVRQLPGTAGPPGQEMTYSNTGWRLAGAALATRHGSYGAALRRLVLDPLGLGIAFPEDETVLLPGLATPLWHDGTAWRRGRYGLHFSASGGLAGSAATLAQWGTALLGGRGAAAGLLQALAAARAFSDGAPSVYALGLARLRVGGVALVGHGGSLPGIKTHLLMAPEMGCGVALITNREDVEPLGAAIHVMAALTGEEAPPAATLPAGLYVAETGEAWAEVEGCMLSFMGGAETLVSAPLGVRTRPAYLDATLRVEGRALDGRIGGLPRRLLPVPSDTRLDDGLHGRWREECFGAVLEIRPDGSARLPGGPPDEVCTLRPLPGGRALAERRHGPWRLRPLLALEQDGTLRLLSHRSRVLRLLRA